MHHDDQIERFRIFVGDYLERSEENLRELESLERQLAGDEPLELTLENELASQFIHSLETGTERELHVNIRNGGLISSLPDECCVEVPCLIGAGGPKPVAVGALPPQLAALNRTFLNVVELTVRAALDGSRDHVYQAALLDPNTAATLTTAQTVAMCDELLDAHRHLLPGGAARLNRHGPALGRTRMTRIRTRPTRAALAAATAALRCLSALAAGVFAPASLAAPAPSGTVAAATPRPPSIPPPVHTGALRISGPFRDGATVAATGLSWRAPALPRGLKLVSFAVGYTWQSCAPGGKQCRTAADSTAPRSPRATTSSGTRTPAGCCGSRRPRPRWSCRRRGRPTTSPPSRAR